MKKHASLSILLMFLAIMAIGQEFKKPSEGKTLVYFARYRGAIALIDFKYYDGQKFLGKGGGNNYFSYECEPGEHVFWVTAENKEFIQGTLRPNATYIIEVLPYFRAVMSGVELNQISPNDKKAVKKVLQLIENKEPTILKDDDEDRTAKIEEGMKRFESIKSDVKKLNSDWTFE